MIADAAVLEGKYVQAFPEFGAERSGAPIAAYVRVSEEPIEIHSSIKAPSVVVVIDKSMAFFKNNISGLARDGYFVSNFDGDPGELRTKLELDPAVKVLALDATGISMKSLGKDIPNTPMLGAMVKATGLVKFESISKVLSQRFKGAVQAGNADALKRGYDEVKSA